MKSRILLSVGFLLGLSVFFLNQNPEVGSALSSHLPAKKARQVQPRRASPVPQVSEVLPPHADDRMEAFASWAALYRQTPAAQRPALIPEGISLVQKRREALIELIRHDPRAALAAAFPLALRGGLPPEIDALLEERISGTGDISLTYRCFQEGPDHGAHEHAPFRSVIHLGRSFEVHAYGSREGMATVSGTTFHGLALDHELALADDRTRILEPGETAGLRPFTPGPLSLGLTADSPLNLADSPVAVEAGGTVHLLPSRDAVPRFEANLRARETVNLADNQPGSSAVVGRPSQAWSQGPKKILVIRVDFSDLAGTPVNYFDGNAPITDTYVSNLINGPGGVAEFFAASSFGKASLVLTPPVAGDSPDVSPVFRMPNTAASYATSGDNDLLHNQARELARDIGGINVDSYDRVGVVFSRLTGINGSKINYGGLANVTGHHFWINSAFNFRVVTHELGHTFGLHHANLWKVSDGNPASSSGSSAEYGDPFDVMGSGDYFENDFSPWNKSILQWIPDSAVTVSQAGGVFRIRRFDSSAADLNLPRALKIVRDSTRDYWIGYRRGTDNPSMDGGAYVNWGYNSNQMGNLLDLNTPNTNPSDAGLAIGQAFNDTTSGITVTPVAQGGGGSEEWLDIQVAFQPRIRWASNPFIINEQGGSAVLTLKRDGNSAGAVSVNFATVAGTAVSPADFTATSGTVSWADGDALDKTITIPVVADSLVEGSENFTVTLSGITGGVVVDGNTATVTLADPGARDVSFSADFINNQVTNALTQPDGSIYIAGFFGQLQDQNFDLYDFPGIARMKSSGAIDKLFNPKTDNSWVRASAILPDGRILVVGDYTTYNATFRGGIARLHTTGALDATFSPGTGANGPVCVVLPLPDGRILIGGSFTSYNGTPREYVARLNADGSLDGSFTGPDFAGTSDWQVRRLAVQTDGKILAGGVFYFPTFGIADSLCRLNTNGTRDTTFSGLTTGPGDAFGGGGYTGEIEDILILPDGKMLVAGDFVSFNGDTARAGLVRLNSTGSVDTTFTSTANGSANTLVLLPDGKALAGGNFTTINGLSATRIARLSTAGALDTGFAAAGGHAGTVKSLSLQSDGRIILGGSNDKFQNSANLRPLWRFHGGLTALPGTVEFAQDAFTADEGTTAVLSLTRTGGSAGALAVSYSTVPGTATAADFTPGSGIVSWANGEAGVKTISIPITADSLEEEREFFAVNLGLPASGALILGERRQATVGIASAFLNWQSLNFTNSEIADPLISGSNADPDQDGVPNLLEFAFGSPPRSALDSRLPACSLANVSGTNYLAVSLRRRIAASGLTYAVETAGSPSGSWGAGAVQMGAPVPQGDGFEVVTFRDSVPSSGTARFMRVLVTGTP